MVKPLEEVVWKGLRITEDGAITRLAYRNTRGRQVPERTAAQHPGGGGYLAVRHHGRHVFAHQAVCSAFHGPRPAGAVVRHLNGDKFDNRAANLAWGTVWENVQDAIAHGTRINQNVRKTRCKRGHALSGSNLKSSSMKRGRRDCLACSRAYNNLRALSHPAFQETSDTHYRRVLADEQRKEAT